MLDLQDQSLCYKRLIEILAIKLAEASLPAFYGSVKAPRFPFFSCYEHRLILKISQDASVLYLETLDRTHIEDSVVLSAGLGTVATRKSLY